jgi:hypothetical protein
MRRKVIEYWPQMGILPSLTEGEGRRNVHVLNFIIT